MNHETLKQKEKQEKDIQIEKHSNTDKQTTA